MFYSTNQKKCDLLVVVLADLISLAWAKEPIINSIWDLIAPIALFNSSKNLISSDDFNSSHVTKNLENVSITKLKFNFKLSQFDQSLLLLLHTIIVKLSQICQRTALELCWNFLFPKLANISNSMFSQFLAMLIMSAGSKDRFIQQKYFL